MKELHPQKRRLNAIRTIERIATKAFKRMQRSTSTSYGAISGTMHLNQTGGDEEDFGVTAGAYIAVSEVGDIFEVSLDLESAGTPGSGKFLSYVSAGVYAWDDIPTNPCNWTRSGTDLSPTTAGDDVKLNDAEVIKLESTSEVAAKLSSWHTGDTFLRFDISSSGILKWGGGSGASDVQLSRSGANTLTLATGDLFIADYVQLESFVRLKGLASGSTPITGYGEIWAKTDGTLWYSEPWGAASHQIAWDVDVPNSINDLNDVTIATVADRDILQYDSGSSQWKNVDGVLGFNIIIDGGGSAITTGVKCFVEVPFSCTLLSWTLLADQSGAIVIDVWKDTYANFPPTDADAMPGSGKEPTIAASAQKAQDTSITDWTTDDISAGDILAFNVDSCTSITRITLCFKVVRTT